MKKNLNILIKNPPLDLCGMVLTESREKFLVSTWLNNYRHMKIKTVRAHNKKRRGIIHLCMKNGWSKKKIEYMMEILSRSYEGCLLYDIGTVDIDGNTVIDEANNLRILEDFKESVKKYL